MTRPTRIISLIWPHVLGGAIFGSSMVLLSIYGGFDWILRKSEVPVVAPPPADQPPLTQAEIDEIGAAFRSKMEAHEERRAAGGFENFTFEAWTFDDSLTQENLQRMLAHVRKLETDVGELQKKMERLEHDHAVNDYEIRSPWGIIHRLIELTPNWTPPDPPETDNEPQD